MIVSAVDPWRTAFCEARCLPWAGFGAVLLRAVGVNLLDRCRDRPWDLASFRHFVLQDPIFCPIRLRLMVTGHHLRFKRNPFSGLGSMVMRKSGAPQVGSQLANHR